MVFKTVYMAGPISGLNYTEATTWRDDVKELLKGHDIKCLSPLRAEVHLRNHEGLLSDCQTVEENLKASCQVLAMSTPRGVFERDKFDATHCSVMLVNLLGAKKVSIGTVIEIGLAHAHSIPIVLVIEDKDNPHEHAFIRESCAFRTSCLNEGVAIVEAILGAY